MDWAVIWFVLIAVIFAVFFILEGFDYGIGIISPVLGRNDYERRALIIRIGNKSRERRIGQLSAFRQYTKCRCSVVPIEICRSAATHDLDQMECDKRTEIAAWQCQSYGIFVHL